MDTVIANFARSFTSEERKEWKEFGELKEIDTNCPLLAWSQKPFGSRTKEDKENGRIFNTISFTETWENSIIQTEEDNYIATKNGVVIAITTADFGAERLYFFETSEYDKALDFYNKMTEALKNNNHH